MNMKFSLLLSTLSLSLYASTAAAIPRELAQCQAMTNCSVLSANTQDSADDSSDFQSAIDALPEGGFLFVPAHPEGEFYTVNNAVNITKKNITIVGEYTTGVNTFGKRALTSSPLIKRISKPNGEWEQRGMFYINGLHDINFRMNGLTFDLEWNGLQIIDPNESTEDSVEAGEVIVKNQGNINSVIFCRRSTGIIVDQVRVQNSSENGLTFFNCGDVRVENSEFHHIYNIGVEFLGMGTDEFGDRLGNSVPMPNRENYEVIDSTFTHINDGKMGAGNGAGVILGSNGSADELVMKNTWVVNNAFSDNLRDIHIETQGYRAFAQNVVFKNNYSQCVKQGSIGVTPGVNVNILGNTIIDPGHQGICLQDDSVNTPNFTDSPVSCGNESYGIVVSGGKGMQSDHVSICNNVLASSEDRLAAGIKFGVWVRDTNNVELCANTIETGSEVALVIGDNIGSPVAARLSQNMINQRQIDQASGVTVYYNSRALFHHERQAPSLITGFSQTYHLLENTEYTRLEPRCSYRQEVNLQACIANPGNADPNGPLCLTNEHDVVPDLR